VGSHVDLEDPSSLFTPPPPHLHLHLRLLWNIHTRSLPRWIASDGPDIVPDTCRKPSRAGSMQMGGAECFATDHAGELIPSPSDASPRIWKASIFLS
jgi:hypothetical protein